VTEPFKFACPHCSNNVSATPEWFGKPTSCPHCSQRFEVPYPPGLQSRVGALESAGPAPTVPMRRDTGPPAPRNQPRPVRANAEEMEGGGRARGRKSGRGTVMLVVAGVVIVTVLGVAAIFLLFT